MTMLLNPYMSFPTAATDPFFANVVLLLDGQGPDGSTTIVDKSPNATSVTSVGGNIISTVNTKYGTSSLRGFSGGYFLATLGTAGSMTGDFTFECWANGTGNVIMTSESGGAYLYNGSFQSYGGPNLALPYQTSGWGHYAISRTGSTLKAFLNGVETDSLTYSSTIDLQTLRFGMFIPNNNLHWIGFWEDIRITKGVGRYTTAFTPPTGRLPQA